MIPQHTHNNGDTLGFNPPMQAPRVCSSQQAVIFVNPTSCIYSIEHASAMPGFTGAGEGEGGAGGQAGPRLRGRGRLPSPGGPLLHGVGGQIPVRGLPLRLRAAEGRRYVHQVPPAAALPPPYLPPLSSPLQLCAHVIREPACQLHLCMYFVTARHELAGLPALRRNAHSERLLRLHAHLPPAHSQASLFTGPNAVPLCYIAVEIPASHANAISATCKCDDSSLSWLATDSDTGLRVSAWGASRGLRTTTLPWYSRTGRTAGRAPIAASRSASHITTTTCSPPCQRGPLLRPHALPPQHGQHLLSGPASCARLAWHQFARGAVLRSSAHELNISLAWQEGRREFAVITAL